MEKKKKNPYFRLIGEYIVVIVKIKCDHKNIPCGTPLHPILNIETLYQNKSWDILSQLSDPTPCWNNSYNLACFLIS